MGKIIGIDPGTTNSAFAYMVAGKPEVIANAEGNRTTPSVVAINKKANALLAKLRSASAWLTLKDTIYGVKRLIGRKFSDDEVQKTTILCHAKSLKRRWCCSKNGRQSTLLRVSAMILSKIKADESFLGEKVTEAIYYRACLLWWFLA